MPDSSDSKRKREATTPDSAGGVDNVRSEGTADRPWEVRIMDSLARTLHHFPRASGSVNPVVTAVAFDTDGKLVVAHNKTSEATQESVAGRLEQVRAVLVGEKSAADAARELARDCGWPGNRAQKEERVVTDLRKLRDAYHGVDNGHAAAPEMQAKLKNVFQDRDNVVYDDLTHPLRRGVIHAEAALIEAAQSQGPLGVSKLSCLDCYTYALSESRTDDLRGTHGQSFSGVVNPGTMEERTEGRADRTVKQYPSDSDSSPPHSSRENSRGNSPEASQPQQRPGVSHAQTEVGPSTSQTHKKGLGR